MSLEFDLELDVPSNFPVWVRLLHLSLHCWNEDSLRRIGNMLKKYIDKLEPMEFMFACTQTCV